MKSINQKTKQAKELDKELDYWFLTADRITWEKGKVLSELKENGLYRYVFGYEKDLAFKHFLAEKGIPYGTADFCIKLYEKYILELGFKPEDLRGIHTRKLHRAIPHITEKNSEKVLEKAKTMLFDDFVAEMTGKEKCRHPQRESKEIKVCKICGKRTNGTS